MAKEKKEKDKGDWVWRQLSNWQKFCFSMNPSDYASFHKNCELQQEIHNLKKRITELERQLELSQ